MGLMNWMADRTMRRTAEEVVRGVTPDYQRVKEQNPNASEKEILGKTLQLGFKFKSPEAARTVIDKHCLSLEGLCYLVAIELNPSMHGQMVFRSLQMIKHIDELLYARGFPRQSLETRRRVYRAMGIDESLAE